jgi:chromosome segregation ATPase
VARITKMDKRKQFQLQLLSNKLAEYTTKLGNLKSKQSELVNSINNVLAQNTLEDKNKHYLLEQKKILEARIQEYKNNLSNCRNEYTHLNHQTKLLPGLLETNKKQELAIYEEEIQNITGRTQEVKRAHLEQLASLEVEKSNLSTQILDLQNQLAASNDNISSIQENAHAYRKNTILELQQKKQ